MPKRGYRSKLTDKLKLRSVREPTTGCLEWIGNYLNGYGVIKDGDGKRHKAHRVSFEYHVRKLNPGECVLHKCDNRSCIEPTHLFAGTRGDNIRDCAAKGRTRNQHTGKLTS